MRRSAAPSQQGPVAKKAATNEHGLKSHFVPPFLSTNLPDVARVDTHCIKSLEATSTPTTRSIRDILHLIQSHPTADSSTVAGSTSDPCKSEPQLTVSDSGPATASSNNGLRQFQSRPQLFDAIKMPPVGMCSSSTAENSQPSDRVSAGTGYLNSEGDVPVRYFSVMWCKVSKKKHKKWEGDAILITKGRSVVLVDMEGKEIGRSSGYKLSELQSLTDGQMLVIGGKEIEVMGILSEDQYKSGRCFQSAVDTSGTEDSCTTRPAPVSKPFIRPFKNGVKSLPVNDKAKGLAVQSLYNPTAANALVMPRPTDSHQWQHNVGCLPIVDVVVDPHISVHLRPHQREGVIFLYQCVMGMKPFKGCGAILADEMGLGKTLQCIAVIWTLLKQGPYGGQPVVKRILIITPGSLVKNWFKEFRKWISSERISVFAVSSYNTVENYAKTPLQPVMIISYEMFVRNVELIRKLNFDLLVCDEGHRLKNANIKTTLLANSLLVGRRIVLTGTPIQNDLQELYAIAEFCNPGILGTVSAFRRVYEDPIVTSRQPTATAEERTIGQNRASELSRITGLFVLRRTQEINNQYLPPRTDIVLFCSLTELQSKLYHALLKSRAVLTCLRNSDATQHLRCISALRKLCNHAGLLYETAMQCAALDDAESDLYRGISDLYPDDYLSTPSVEFSGKMMVLASLLHGFSRAASTEKVVIVSSYTSTLDLIETLCKESGYQLLRLDGQTPTARRLELVERFNNRHSPEFVFLLSTKAGGIGLNLVGASRLILFDVDWNPANDLQAMARVWRDGQRRRTYVYRLLTTGTIEEKIYQRQVSKQGLTGAVVDAKTTDDRVLSFDAEHLRELFALNEKTLCATHDLLDCQCTEFDGLRPSKKLQDTSQAAVRPCQLGPLGTLSGVKKNTSMDELLEWNHLAGPLPDLSNVDPLVESQSLQNVTFALWTVNNPAENIAANS